MLRKSETEDFGDWIHENVAKSKRKLSKDQEEEVINSSLYTFNYSF